MLGIIMPFGIGWSVILGALRNPGTDDRDFRFCERSLAFGHSGFAILRCDHFQNGAFFGIFWDNRRAFAIAAREEAFELGHDITALVFCGLMATLAIGLQDGPNVVIVTDFRGLFGARDGTFRGGAVAAKRQRLDKAKKQAQGHGA